MIKIGMIGADSTHTESYGKLVNLPGAPLYGRAQVVKLWGEDRAQAEAKAQQVQITQVVATPTEAISGVDLVMVCHRYGDDHPEPAQLAIAAGLPTFVDKPFANDFVDVHRLVELAKPPARRSCLVRPSAMGWKCWHWPSSCPLLARSTWL